MKYFRFSGFKITILLINIICINSTYSFAVDTKFVTTGPDHGAIIDNNMPVLTWQSLNCNYYQLWIDGIKIDSIIGSQNWYIPFPLSYGSHLWQVIAISNNLKIASDICKFTVEDSPLSELPENAILLRNDWKVISSYVSGNVGSVISGKNLNTGSWQSSSVPATVLSVMVRNGLYPNPYLSINNVKIPDCNDDFNKTYNLLQYSHLKNINPWINPYWFRKEFNLPQEFKNKTLWLNLGEINYKAQVWLNGELLADTNEIKGMERKFRFDITSFTNLKSTNVLAIAIYPPDHPGKPADEPLTPLADPGTNMADGIISKDYTKWDVMGWDWQPSIRDRDMGITEDVFINATDDIEIENLYVTSDLPLPDTNYAHITISADLINHSKKSKEGIIRASVSFGTSIIELAQIFTINPEDTIQFFWNKENMPDLHIENPKLWWPNGYGNPELYSLKINASTNNGDFDIQQIKFGIREFESFIGPKERIYKINGREIYCKGGNWVIDMMINWTAKRYEDEILLTKKANLNILRIWGPTGVPPEVFYDAADQNGILIWQDFLNDYWGTFKNTPGYRPDIALFERNTSEIVKKLRNHPSVVIWCGGNEGPNPREELIVNKILPKYDGRGSRFYLKSSDGDGHHGGGPYHMLEPSAYFTHPKINGFSSEIGASGVPVYESASKFMPNIGKSWMPGRYPIDGIWAYHDANDWPGSDTRKFSSYDNIIRNYYGVSDSTSANGAKNYFDKCQLVNYDISRAGIEAINSQLWKNSSGILLWKSNSGWPSLTWQVYDWYLQAHAGYYGLKKAAAPVGIQFNRKSMKIEILNATFNTIQKANIKASLYDIHMTKIWELSENIDLQKNSVSALNDPVPVTDSLCFLKLVFKNQSGNTLSDNFYWLNNKNDFKILNSIPEPVVEISTEKYTDSVSSGYNISISNTGKIIAFQLELKLTETRSELEILPCFWSDNYFSLLPGENKMVHVETGRNVKPGTIMLKYKAFNMKEVVLLNL